MLGMNFASVLPCSLIDYPHTIAAILFTRGCNFRCSYCHNPDLVDPARLQVKNSTISEGAILHFLAKRIGLLEGVVICGGEPTLHQGLAPFLSQVKSLGFKVKLDTNGSRPEVIQDLIQNGLIDYIAMDVKSPITKYTHIVRKDVNANALQESIQLLLSSSIPYEFRTTVIPRYHGLHDLKQMGDHIRGAKHWALQQFRSAITLDPDMRECNPYTLEELQAFALQLGDYAEHIEVRH